jgi:hypothetical protein
MTSLTTRLIFCTAGLVALSALGLAQTSTPAGRWEGTIKTERADLPIVVDLAPGPKGAWIGSITVTGSTSVDVPLGDLAIKAKMVRFTAHVPVLATFDGTLATEAGTMTGTASSTLGETTFQLKRTGEAQVKIPPASSALKKEFTGSWEGTLDAGGKQRRIGLKLSAASDGTAKGTLIALDRGNVEIPFTTVTIKGRELQLETRALSGTFRGTISDQGEIAGEWDQGTTHTPLVFKPVASGAKSP